MKKVSVIIPVYNVERFLVQCLDSAFGQTYKNIEIILVDDGSTDESGKICDAYCEGKSNFKIIHKLNGGLSDARNCGIDNSTGDYLFFLDSDDLIEKDTIKVLMEMCEREKADIGILDYNIFFDRIPGRENENTINYIKMDSKEAIELMLKPGNYDHCACAKLYRRELWNDVKFPKGMLYEDLCINYDIFHSAKIIMYIPVKKYYYRMRSDSIMNSTIKPKDIELLDISDSVATRILKWHPDFDEIVLNKQSTTYANLLYRIMLSDDYPQYEDSICRIKRLCRNNLLRCLRSKEMRTNDKIKVLLICINKKLYLRVYKYITSRKIIMANKKEALEV